MVSQVSQHLPCPVTPCSGTSGHRLSVGSRKNVTMKRFWRSEGFPTAGLPRSCTLCSQKPGQCGGKQNPAELRLQRVCAGTCEMHQEGANTGLGILSCCCGNHINSNKCVVNWVRESVAACDTLCKINESCFMNDSSGHLKVKVSHAKDAEGAFLY